MEATQDMEARQAVERLKDWIREGPEVCRQLLDQLRMLQEQVNAERVEHEHWQRQAEASQQECERLRQAVVEIRAENEQLRKDQAEWETVLGSVNETTRQMNELIVRLRGSRGKAQ